MAFIHHFGYGLLGNPKFFEGVMDGFVWGGHLHGNSSGDLIGFIEIDCHVFYVYGSHIGGGYEGMKFDGYEANGLAQPEVTHCKGFSLSRREAFD